MRNGTTDRLQGQEVDHCYLLRLSKVPSLDWGCGSMVEHLPSMQGLSVSFLAFFFFPSFLKSKNVKSSFLDIPILRNYVVSSISLLVFLAVSLSACIS